MAAYLLGKLLAAFCGRVFISLGRNQRTTQRLVNGSRCFSLRFQALNLEKPKTNNHKTLLLMKTTLAVLFAATSLATATAGAYEDAMTKALEQIKQANPLPICCISRSV